MMNDMNGVVSEQTMIVSDVNGVEPEQLVVGAPAVSKDCEDVAKLFDQLAADARKGLVSAACVVSVKGPGTFSPSFTGNLLMEQYIGCDMVKAHLTAMMAGQHPIQQQQRAARPQIMRPPPGMQVK